jgi:hypothetical protein
MWSKLKYKKPRHHQAFANCRSVQRFKPLEAWAGAAVEELGTYRNALLTCQYAGIYERATMSRDDDSRTLRSEGRDVNVETSHPSNVTQHMHIHNMPSTTHTRPKHRQSLQNSKI